MPGGWSDKLEISPEDELYEYFTELEDEIEAHLDTDYDNLEPVRYSQQVVAGMKYDVIYEAGYTTTLEVHLFRSLSGETEILDVEVFEEDPGLVQVDEICAGCWGEM